VVKNSHQNLTVLENVIVSILNGRRYGKISMEEARELAENIIETIGLSKFKESPSKSLNAQGRKRLEIARALGAEPELMLLDECLAGLTPSEILEMLNIIRRIKSERKITILMIEHLMHAVMNISDRIAVLHEGVKIAEGKPEDIAGNIKVAEVYFGDRELALKFVKR
jgi:branched-chain amino acid transport system ATP-binding protein